MVGCRHVVEENVMPLLKGKMLISFFLKRALECTGKGLSDMNFWNWWPYGATEFAKFYGSHL